MDFVSLFVVCTHVFLCVLGLLFSAYLAAVVHVHCALGLTSPWSPFPVQWLIQMMT